MEIMTDIIRGRTETVTPAAVTVTSALVAGVVATANDAVSGTGKIAAKNALVVWVCV